jgi:hypothetical protein
MKVQSRNLKEMYNLNKVLNVYLGRHIKFLCIVNALQPQYIVNGIPKFGKSIKFRGVERNWWLMHTIERTWW